MEPAHPSPTIDAVLSARHRAFLEQPLFAAIATTDANGAPRQAVIWYHLEDDGRILINSRQTRFWPANLRRDGRVSLAILAPDGYSWLGLTGRVDAIDEDPARSLADIEALAWRYHPDGPDPDDLASYRAYPRITFRLAIDRVHDHLED
ncbi:MAG: PPOX class F420-dependent oxidoreductase [Chloroflexi bacterium]|nr:MAG: PPOX class F420-dependent oxidoreductase [Chloroflexota bacterium]